MNHFNNENFIFTKYYVDMLSNSMTWKHIDQNTNLQTLNQTHSYKAKLNEQTPILKPLINSFCKLRH